MTRTPAARPPQAQVRREIDDEPRLAWLSRRKVTVPDRPAGYTDRARLVEWAMPVQRRLTALVAPGGFGKTTLLAECCRRLSGRGIVTAWLSVDGNEDAEVFDAYLAFAFQYAGLSIEHAVGDGSPAGSRVELLARSLEARGEPFVLALDDLHRLEHPGASALLDALIRDGPSNLHLAAACRRLPARVNIGGPALDGQAAVIGVDELRFSKAEIRAFFGPRRSARELAALAEESAGWPMALRIEQNRGGAAPDTARRMAENWVESRLWEGIGADDRELLLDAGLFEWLDAALLDEVLGGHDALRRLRTMEALAGFLEPVQGSGPPAWRLHPLIREHCALQRFRDARPRYRTVHRRIATALVRRGEVLPALHHALEAGDSELAGDIVEDAGGIRLWLRYGLTQFCAAIERLDTKVIEARPRLRFARCAALVFAGQVEQARAAYRALAEEPDSPPDTDGEAGFERWLDECIVRGLLVFYAGGTVGSEQTAAAAAHCAQIADCERAEPLVRGYAEHSLCIAHNVTAQFPAALERAARALTHFSTSGFGRMMVELQRGQAAMAQGRTAAAGNGYAAALKAARASHIQEPVWAAIATVLQRELDLERNRLAPSPQPPGIPPALTQSSTPFQAYAAAADVVIARALAESGPERALELLDAPAAFVHEARLVPLVRVLAAMRVSLLVDAARPGDAERAWTGAALPDSAQACLDLQGQSWREMEALSCAWLRLSIALERFDEARAFAAELRAASAARNLRRTLMRALVLGIVLEARAGEPDAADGHLAAFLALFAETDYARFAVLERGACAPAVERFVAAADDSPLCAPAQSLLAAMGRRNAEPGLALSARELQVLQHLDGRSDKVIAAELDLTAYGVRYHLRSVFSKLGVNRRGDAVRQARELGLIAAED